MNATANDEPKRPLGVILAGGLARRMGGGDKGLVALGGRPMLARVVAALTSQCGDLILNANGDAARFAGLGLSVVPDTVAGFAGPLAGVLAGMEWATSHRPGVGDILTFPADTPFPPTDLVERLCEARRAAGATVAVAGSGGRRHHVVALWPVSLASALRRALVEEGLRKVESFAERFPVAVAQWGANPDDPFFNVNTTDDLAEAEARLSGGGGAPRRDGVPPV